MNLDWATNILFSADSPPMYLPDKTGDDEFFPGVLQGLVNVPFWEYWTSPKIVAI